ncbi:unnamed protein product [Durusdinium trenchii]|uniref:Uncharacterized protein n=2 Tax=Durusdinium trenchii TaxID=1381693 RepID=A0ABP0J5D3_9DINO
MLMAVWPAVLLALLAPAAAQGIGNLSGEVARRSCALGRHDCSRQGRRLLLAGGYLLPSCFDVRLRRRCVSGPPPASPMGREAVVEEVDATYESAVVNASLVLRFHLATLLEYTQRAEAVRQVGDVEASWVAILRGALSQRSRRRSRSFRYHVLDPMPELVAFLEKHPKFKALGIQVDFADSVDADVLFFASSRLLDFSLVTGSTRYILVHGTQEAVGSAHTLDQMQSWLDVNKAWRFAEYSALGSGFAVLERSQRSWERPANCSWDASAWSNAMRLASELLVVQHEYPSSLGATWRVDGPVLQSMSRKLQALRRSCVGSLEIQAAQLILRRFRRGEEQLMKGDFFETPSLVAVPGLPIEVAESHPELSLLLLYSGLPTETYRQLLDISIARWPHRVEFWYLLALSPEGQSTTRVHAIRRCVSLAHFDRSIVHQLLKLLNQLFHAREARLLWAAVAGNRSKPWDDRRRSAFSSTWVAQVVHGAVFPGSAWLAEHPEFAFAQQLMEARAQELLQEQLKIIQTYSSSKVNGYCKDNGWCEYVFLMFEYCHFLSECVKVPKTCRAMQEMEQKGLRLLRASLSLAGSPEVEASDMHRRHVYIQPHASPEIGRMRLSCTLVVSPQTSSTLRIEGERPRVYQPGKCFWFDESMTHEMDFEANGPETLRATLYLDALHPGYYGEQSIQHRYYPIPNSVPWWRTILERLASQHRSTPPTIGASPQHYSAAPRQLLPWLSYAVEAHQVDADICLRGDFGRLFHDNAFWNPGDRHRPLTMLQLFQRMRTLEHLGTVDPDLRSLLERNRRFTQQDLDELTQDTWTCLALGCQGCKALEMFGLCWHDLAEEILLRLLRGFSQTLHLHIYFLRRWFTLLGLGFPPKGGYGLTREQLFSILQERRSEAEAFFSEVS